MSGSEAKKGSKSDKAAQQEQTTPREFHAVPEKYLARQPYREALQDVDEFLGFAFFRLQELKADLAIAGSHKKWAEKQGSMLFLDDLDFDQSDDPVVRDLTALHARLKEVFDRLPVDGAGKVKQVGAEPASPSRGSLH
jgi:hypothetical protein